MGVKIGKQRETLTKMVQELIPDKSALKRVGLFKVYYQRRGAKCHINLPLMGSMDPLLYLYSSDSEGQVDTIRVNDEGSRPQYVAKCGFIGSANFRNHKYRSRHNDNGW